MAYGDSEQNGYALAELSNEAFFLKYTFFEKKMQHILCNMK